MEFPNKRYKTLVIDPPWPIEPMILKKYQLSIPYKTMTLKDIEKLPNRLQIFCLWVIFLWTTHTFLPYSFQILEKWGFKYYVTLTWDKVSGLTHQGFFRVTEFVLVGYKGKLTKTIEQKGRAIPCLFRESKGSHSIKPIKFDEIIRRCTPEPRIDIFARKKKLGYDFSFGNDEKLNEEKISLESYI